MKVYIGPYRNNYSGYWLTKKILFWVDQFKDESYPLFDVVQKFFSYFNPVFRWLNRIDNRKINIHIDNYDVWNIDHTLALIIHPMLVKYKEIGISYGYIDNDDVPKNLRVSKSLKDENKISKIKEKQWQWFLDELIWTFEQLVDNDWENQYTIEEGELDFDDYPEDEGKECTPVRWKKEYVINYEGLKAHRERISNGLRLFGKYFRTLWD